MRSADSERDDYERKIKEKDNKVQELFLQIDHLNKKYMDLATKYSAILGVFDDIITQLHSFRNSSRLEKIINENTHNRV